MTGIEPLSKDAIPALVAGLAMSPDGDRLAYTTAPCKSDDQRDAEPRANVTVLDIDSGRRRTWATAAPSLIGEIVWARDNHTLGYTVSDVLPSAPSGSGTGDLPPGAPLGRDIGNLTVHALDTDAQGTDLRAGRVLFSRTIPGRSPAP